MILTDEEIKAALDSVAPCLEDRDILYSRAIEAAIMAKFEVVAYGRFDEDDNGRLCGALDFENPPLYVKPLYALKEK